MSQRTIVEFNHDYAHEIERDSEDFVALLKTALASGDDRYWTPLRMYGVRKGLQAHHSDERSCEVRAEGCNVIKATFP